MGAKHITSKAEFDETINADQLVSRRTQPSHGIVDQRQSLT